MSKQNHKFSFLAYPWTCFASSWRSTWKRKTLLVIINYSQQKEAIYSHTERKRDGEKPHKKKKKKNRTPIILPVLFSFWQISTTRPFLCEILWYSLCLRACAEKWRRLGSYHPILGLNRWEGLLLKRMHSCSWDFLFPSIVGNRVPMLDF